MQNRPKEPIIVTRRGRKIAGIVSFSGLVFLERMKARRQEILNMEPPKGVEAGQWLAKKLEMELLLL